MVGKLNFKHIETIHAVILTGSVTGAATRLYVTQPAISNVLRDAEERLGCQLFERRGGRLLPTPLADMLFDEIERSFTGLAAINVFCEQALQSQRRRLRVACTPAFGASVFPWIAKTYGGAPHDLFLTVHSRVAHHVVALVSSRKADIGFGLDAPEVAGVESEVLAELPLYCYLPADHPLAREPFLTAQLLQAEPLISISRLEGIDDMVTRAFQLSGCTPVTVAECPAAITAVAMVAAGLGFTLMDLLPSTLFDASRVAVRPFVPDSRLIYKAYWLKSMAQEIDAPALVQVARGAMDRVLDQAKRDKA